jgi:hypothetical protein
MEPEVSPDYESFVRSLLGAGLREEWELILRLDSPTKCDIQRCGVLIKYANQHTWEHQLQVGEMLIFNKQQMLPVLHLVIRNRVLPS